MKRVALALCLGLVATAPAMQAGAWGATGHRLIGVAAMRALPDEIPAFLRTPGAVADIGELAREPDRWKGGGQPHDRERDTAHFIDLNEDGHVFIPAGPHIDSLPTLKSEYDAALIAAGLNVNDAGYLPYAIWDGWQQVVRDFAYWRVLVAAEAREADPGRRAWYREDRERRERLLIRDLGVWAHYIGDASQPHHTTIHFNGWDRDTPNPENFTRSRRTHSEFEGAFTRRVARLDLVEAAMPAPNLDGFQMRPRVAGYIRATLGQVTPFYRLEKAGGFQGEDARGAAFVTERLAAGAAELRDMTILAWRASANSSVGWPALKVSDVVDGGVDPWGSLYALD